MTDDLISRAAVTAVAEFLWGKGYPKIADLLWELRAALDAAEARERQAVDACAKVRVAAPSEAPGLLDYYTFRRGWDAGISAKNAAIRAGAKR